MRIVKFVYLFFIVIQMNSLFAQAQVTTPFDYDRRLVLPRTLSLAGANNARVSMNESLYYNPASSAHTRLFSSEFNYGWNYIPNQSARVDNYSVSMLDTGSEFFGGGFALTNHSIQGTGSEWDIRGLFNRAFFGNRVGFGFTMIYTKTKYFDVRDSNFNANVGLLILASKGLSFGLVGYNLVGDNKNNVFTRSIALATRYTFLEFFAVDFDFTHKIDKKFTFSSALEMLYRSGLMCNFSFMRDQQFENNLWGMGVGFVAPKMSIIYGTLNAISPPFSFRHSLSLRIFM